MAVKGQGARVAPTPPMGWNSWNSFATTINEDQALETARIMADKLLPFGYDIFTIDIQWYEPQASSYEYSKVPRTTLDEYGRAIPAPGRFPSSRDGSGFTAIAKQVHDLGLKFGIHVMRGIPRLAVERNLRVLGSKASARDIADTASVCSWNPDMYGVDMSRTGAQAYYNSLFALYASWGVDFVKMDDMSRPYDARAAEIEAAHLAIKRSGRPMALSLSPGETPVSRGDHVRRFAQVWRISDDFWDEWPMLEAQFTRLENWNEYRAPGAWPDPDMLLLGRLALGARDTRFTADEQRSLMSLWAITRSPLIMGGDLRYLDAPTLDLLTNRDVIALNQSSTDNRPHFLLDGIRLWTAKSDGTAYLAVFNVGPKPREIELRLADLDLAVPSGARDLWSGAPVEVTGASLRLTLHSHGCRLMALSFAS